MKVRAPFALLIPLAWLFAGSGEAAARQASPDDEIARIASQLARAWGGGDVEGVADHLSRDGIRLRLDGLDRSALSTRQAQAALREFLRGYTPGRASVVRAAPGADAAGRGFAELRWETRVSGTSHPVTHSVFVGLVREGERWRVDELRLLP